jgi:hypothetical protein
MPYNYSGHDSLNLPSTTSIAVAGKATGLCARRSRIRILLGVKDFSLLQNFQSSSGAHPASYSMGTGVLSRR